MKKWPLVKVGRRFQFSAFHCLPLAGNPLAKRKHDHLYTVWITMEHEINPSCGWAKDFDEIDIAVGELFTSMAGKDLNELLDPVPPTSEAVACYILTQLPGWVEGVKVSESDRSFAEVTRKMNGRQRISLWVKP